MGEKHSPTVTHPHAPHSLLTGCSRNHAHHSNSRWTVGPTPTRVTGSFTNLVQHIAGCQKPIPPLTMLAIMPYSYTHPPTPPPEHSIPGPPLQLPGSLPLLQPPTNRVEQQHQHTTVRTCCCCYCCCHR
jgi:hypothetical protein